jgi:hypothetical protein
MKTRNINSDIQDLRRLRDELRVQLHLAKAEGRDAFDRLEKKWPAIESGVARLEKAADAAKDEVGHALRDLVRELREGYAALRRP